MLLHVNKLKKQIWVFKLKLRLKKKKKKKTPIRLLQNYGLGKAVDLSNVFKNERQSELQVLIQKMKAPRRQDRHRPHQPINTVLLVHTFPGHLLFLRGIQ